MSVRVTLLLTLYMLSGSLSAIEAVPDMDSFFDKSPEELAATSVSTASGTATTVARSASVTSVITAAQIKSMGATELHEVLETVPGMHASMQALVGDYHYTVRGIHNVNNAQLLFLLNGTRITLPVLGTLLNSVELPLEAIKQIEIIRGPGSALYGADAFAGVINIITKQASDIDGLTLGVRAGDHDSQSGWGQYGGKWAGWAIASSLQYQKTAGDNGRTLDADSQSIFDTKFGTQASHAPGALNSNYQILNGHLTLQRNHWDIGLWALSNQGGVRAGVVNALDPEGETTAEQYQAQIRFSTQDWFEDWEFSAQGSYLHADFKSYTKSFPNNALLPIGADGNVSSEPVGLVSFPDGDIRSLGFKNKIPAFEITSLYKGLDGHLLRSSSGFRYEQLTTSHRANVGTGIIDGSVPIINGTLTDVTGTPYAYLADRQRSIWSAAVQDEWQLTPDWQLTTGVRYDHYSDFGSTLNPRATLLWEINEALLSKLLYGRAFRAPSFAEMGSKNNLALTGNPDLAPETIDTVEWALDYHPLAAFRTAANLYYYHLSDLITLVPDSGKSTSTFQNAGNQEGYGLELEGQWHIDEQWQLAANYAWQRAINQVTDQRVSGVPAHQVYAAATWQFLPQWQIQSQLNWVGSRINPIPGNGPLNDYQTVDFTLRGNALFKQLNLAASLRNAFDATPLEPAVAVIGENLPMPGRSFYLEVSLHF